MSDASPDFALMRASMLLETDPAAAAREAGTVLDAHPGHEQANLLLAEACRRLGDASTAVAVLEGLAAVSPASAVLQMELGRALAAAARFGEAKQCFERAVALDATLADAWRELAAQRFLAGEDGPGDLAYLQFMRLTPQPHELADAGIALVEGRLDAAAALVERHLRTPGGYPVAWLLYAQVAERRGDLPGAEAALHRCLDIAPGFAAARYELARLLHAQQRILEVLPLVERLLNVEPAEPRYLSLKAQAIRLVGRTAEAVEIMERLVRERPDDATAWRLHGNLLRAAGDQAGAIASYRRAIAVQPGNAEAYWSLANMKTVQLSTQDITDMRAELARAPALGSQGVSLEFSLGKALEDVGDYQAAFAHYQRGNERHRVTVAYDAAVTTGYVERAKRLFTQEFFAERAGWGSDRPDPIFIIGLPRSGSTLLEQMLASHSHVEGTHELPDMPRLVTDTMLRLNAARESEYPDPIARLTRSDVADLSHRYLAQTDIHRPHRLSRFVDKMLGNFSHLGFIHLLFPRAAIIDARRHPIACGFSCYKQLFARGMNFSYDMTEMGLYCRDYVRLMQHFEEMLPGRVLRVHYEHVVADPEHELRRMLDFCQLPFESECLRFYDNQRVVMTISSEQVRRPIYADSVEQWRRFEPWLTPLREAIGSDILDAYPARSGSNR